MKKILMFSLPNCGPCKMMKPKFKKLSEDIKDVEFQNIDTEEQYELSEKFNIQAAPTFIKLIDDVEVERAMGNLSFDKLKEFIER